MKIIALILALYTAAAPCAMAADYDSTDNSVTQSAAGYNAVIVTDSVGNVVYVGSADDAYTGTMKFLLADGAESGLYSITMSNGEKSERYPFYIGTAAVIGLPMGQHSGSEIGESGKYSMAFSVSDSIDGIKAYDCLVMRATEKQGILEFKDIGLDIEKFSGSGSICLGFQLDDVPADVAVDLYLGDKTDYTTTTGGE